MCTMTSTERIMATLSHKPVDRIPYILPTLLQGAKELGMSIPQYFSKAENVANGQLKLQQKYGHDALDSFYYASLEIEAFGGTTKFYKDGPPNCGSLIIKTPADILKLKCPKIEEQSGLKNVLETIRLLKNSVGDSIPIINAAVSPFSLPIMQMGFDKYLEMLYGKDENSFEELMKINEEFSTNWINAMFDAGATMVVYFDPMSSPSIIPKNLFLKTGFKIAQRLISKSKGPIGIHFASGRVLPIIEEIKKLNVAVVGVSTLDNISELKSKCGSSLNLIGNLNGIEMAHWSHNDTELKIKELIATAASGGGWIISDNHGEIPWQVPESVLLDIGKTVRRWGSFPLDWIKK